MHVKGIWKEVFSIFEQGCGSSVMELSRFVVKGWRAGIDVTVKGKEIELKKGAWK